MTKSGPRRWPVLLLLTAIFLAGCSTGSAPISRVETTTPVSATLMALPSATPTRTVTPRLRPTGQRTLRVTRVPSATVAPRLPRPTATPSRAAFPSQPTIAPPPFSLREVFINGISGHGQRFPLGCEASAAVDWAAFFGVEINEGYFQLQLPISDNPDKGFVGNVNDTWGQIPPFSYGVHAGPVAALLREQYGLPAAAYKDFTLEQIKAEIDQGQPVIVWVIGNVSAGRATWFTDMEGDSVLVARYEHVVIVTGYSEVEDTVYYMNNGRSYITSTDRFIDSYSVLGSMALVFEDPEL